MPALISTNEFIEETRDDYNSPTTSTFGDKIPSCRRTVVALEEVRILANNYLSINKLDFDHFSFLVLSFDKLYFFVLFFSH